MESQIREIDEVTREISVTIPKETVVSRYSAAISEVAQTTKMKGFRPGTAPAALVEKMHGKRVGLEVAHQLISNSLMEVIREHELPMVGDPDIDFENFDPKSALEFKASVFLYPAPEIAIKDSYSVEVEKPSVGNDDVEKVVTRLRESRATTEKLAFRQTAEMGDVIEGVMAVSVEGEEAARPEPVTIPLGDEMLPSDVEQGIVGLEIGSKVEVKTIAPETHPNEDLRGKELSYSFELQGLSEKKLPEENDEFAKSLNMEVETVLELRGKIREQLEAEVDRDGKASAQSKVLEQISEANEFKIPQVLIDNEIRNLLARQGFIDPQKVDPSRIDVTQFREGLGPIAEQRVRTSIIVDRLAEQDEVKLSTEELDAAYEELAQSNGIDKAQVKKSLAEMNQLEFFEREQVRSKVLDSLLDRSKVEYVEPKEEEPKEEAEDAKAAE